MNGSRLADYLDHMRQAAEDSCSFVSGMEKRDFLADKRTQRAVIMSPVIIGEAATKVMDGYADFADAHPEVPWRSVRGMRNRIAHGYFGGGYGGNASSIGMGCLNGAAAGMAVGGPDGALVGSAIGCGVGAAAASDGGSCGSCGSGDGGDGGDGGGDGG